MTIKSFLKKGGYKAYKKPKMPRLTKAPKQTILDFAIQHADWTIKDWCRVIWSDECKVTRYQTDLHSKSWRKATANLQGKNV